MSAYTKALARIQSQVSGDWRDRRDIPNTEFFKLVVRYIDGREVNAMVTKNSVTGSHYLTETNTSETVDFAKVQDWKPRN